VDSGFRKAFKGNWGAQPHTKRIGIVQDLNRLSFNSALSHLRKTNLPLDATAKVVGPRVLHSTQWGFFDPIDTPDGGNIGLHKHLSISAYITQGVSREPMLQWLREKVDMKLLEDCSPKVLSTMTKVILNGLWAGAIIDPIETVEKIKLYRRNALIPIYTSVTFDIKKNTIFIYTDAGRLCRPIIYRDSETGKLSIENKQIIKRLEESDFKWSNLITGFNPKKIENFDPNQYKMYELSELYDNIDSESNPAKLQRFLDDKAIIDYIDTNECEDALIALNKEELKNDKKHTHLEIHESLILGVMCNLINFPENNPATRNSFSCGQSKQAVSMYHTNHQVRMDKTAVVLVSGQVPLVKSRYLEYINNEGNPYGENAIVAIMCYTGYNVEDAMLINEGSLKRGLFRTTYFSTYESHEEKTKTGDATVDKLFTNIENETNVIGTKPGFDYSKLDKDGLIRENTPIDDKTVLIGLTASSNIMKDIKMDMSKTPKKGQLGIVDKTFITDSEEGKRIAKVRVREVRIPNIGDKMASRSGQKGTIGLVVPEQDMPFTKDGIRPDLIINPHALPSRMTIGQLVECIIGKAAAQYGGFSDCTAFINKGSKIGVFGELLPKVGFHSSGNEVLYNGMTGEQLEAEIFMGPNYYMRLKHMVKDKINYRALGPRTALTKQPVSGRANDGGLRIGEMERDSVISHGAVNFLTDSMMERGDKYYMAICNNTGMLAIYNPSKNIFMSPMADGPVKYIGSLDGKDMHIENVTKFGRSFSVVKIPYSLKLLIQELQTMNVQMRLITEENIQQIENMTYSKNIDKLMFKSDIKPEEIVTATKQALSGKNTDISTPVSIHEKSPEYKLPGEDEFSMPDPRDYALPAPNEATFLPYSPESPPYAPKDSIESPPYAPESPPYNPNTSTKYYSKSPEYPGNNSLESPQFAPALTTEVGDRVHYRGDTIPNRVWTIIKKGDNFITIKSLDEVEDIKVVRPNEIYEEDDYSYMQSPPMQRGGMDQMPMMNMHQRPTYGEMYGEMYRGQKYGDNGVPSINFAPVIKVMNGGSDFSSDPNAAGGANTMNPIENHMSQDHIMSGGANVSDAKPIIVKDGGSNSEPKPVEQSGSIFDMGKLLIKKIGL